MTREEAIQILSTRDKYGVPCGYTSGYQEALDMAIEALSAEYEDYEHATLVDIKEPLKVLVVRCKDCIYYETCNLRSSHWWKGGYTVDIEFCSFGERREP